MKRFHAAVLIAGISLFGLRGVLPGDFVTWAVLGGASVWVVSRVVAHTYALLLDRPSRRRPEAAGPVL